MSAMPDTSSELRLITFPVGPETFVLDIMALRQIIPYTGSTSVPTAPAFIEGIIVLRNEVIPIIDLRGRLYPQLQERSEQPLVLITHTSAGMIGFKVDAVRRIVTSHRRVPPAAADRARHPRRAADRSGAARATRCISSSTSRTSSSGGEKLRACREADHDSDERSTVRLLAGTSLRWSLRIRRGSGGSRTRSSSRARGERSP